MNRGFTRALACAAVLCLLLNACSGKNGNSGGEGAALEAPSGGYLEQPCALPEGIKKLDAAQTLSDGAIALLAYTVEGYKLFTSTATDTWTEKSVLTDGDMWIAEADIMPDGSMTLIVQRLLDEGQGASLSPDRLLARVDKNGAVEINETPILSADDPMDLFSMQMTENGDLLLETSNGVLQIDPATCQIKHKYNDDKEHYLLKSYTTIGDALFLTVGDEIIRYDMVSGDMTDSFAVEPTSASDRFYEMSLADNRNSRVLTPANDKTSLFYCDENGISRHVIDGGLSETVMGSEGTSISLPTRKPLRLFVDGDDSFRILFTEPGNRFYLAKYTYASNMPAKDTRLKIYSMFDSKQLRQAIGTYQISHPGIQFDYTVAASMSQDGTADISLPDILRSLSVELLAGNGADVMLLDDLPISSYAEKGVLLDLTGMVTEKAGAGEWLPEIVTNFKQDDGKIYGVPSRFNFNYLAGSPEAVDAIHDFDSLTQWLEKEHEKNPDIHSLRNSGWENLMFQFYPSCVASWRKGDTVDREAAAQFLRNIKRIDEINADKEKLDYWYRDSGSWYKGLLALDVGLMRSVEEDVVTLNALFSSEKEARLALLPGAGEQAGYYLPTEVIGINAGSSQLETAKDFLESVLSAEVQDYEFFAGFPVNAEVLNNQLASTRYSPEEYVPDLWFSVLDGTNFSVENTWPNPEFVESFRQLLGQLTTPTFFDGRDDVFFEECAPYFQSDAPLEECIENYCQKLSLVGAE